MFFFKNDSHTKELNPFLTGEHFSQTQNIRGLHKSYPTRGSNLRHVAHSSIHAV